MLELVDSCISHDHPIHLSNCTEVAHVLGLAPDMVSSHQLRSPIITLLQDHGEDVVHLAQAMDFRGPADLRPFTHDTLVWILLWDVGLEPGHVCQRVSGEFAGKTNQRAHGYITVATSCLQCVSCEGEGKRNANWDIGCTRTKSEAQEAESAAGRGKASNVEVVEFRDNSLDDIVWHH